MADAQTPNRLFTEIEVGASANSWGTKNNANWARADRILGDTTTVTTTGGNTALTDDEQDVAIVKTSGILVSNAEIRFDTRRGWWFVYNGNTGAFTTTFLVAGQTGVAVAQGSYAIVSGNGTDIIEAAIATNVISDTSPQLGADLDGQGFDLNNLGVVFLTEQAAAEADVAGKGQWWVKTATPNVAMFTDDAGTDFQLATLAGTETFTNKTFNANGTGNVLSNVEVADFAAAAIVTEAEGLDSSDNDTSLPTTAAVKDYVDTEIAAIPGASGVPVGTVAPYAGASAPSEWLLCYGQAISRTTYSALFAITSTTYGVGDGSTTFNVPDLRGRVVAGQDDMGGVSANHLTGVTGSVNGDTLGGTGGEETHTLTTAEMPAHTHSTASTLGTGSGFSGGDNSPSSEDTGSTGGGGAHNNVQPTIILNYIIFTGV